MKKQIIKSIIAILFALLIVSLIIVYSNNKFIANRESLMELLEIKEAETFTPINVNLNSDFRGDGEYYEIKFEISKDDYNKNNLEYNEESYYDMLIECKYKEAKDKNTYICIRRVSEMYNKELFEKIKELDL